MDDLILRLRLETLRRTLREVEHLKDALEVARKDLNELARVLLDRKDGIESAAMAIADNLPPVINRVRRVAGEIDDPEPLVEAQANLKNVSEASDKLNTDVETARAIIRRLKAQWERIDESRIGLTLEKQIETTARETTARVGEAEKRLGQAASPQALGDIWRTFQGILKGGEEADGKIGSDALFEEYVDLLAGLALRTVGFAHGHDVCPRADQLLSVLYNVSSKPEWYSLSVPARTEALRMTPAQIVRLGYPGWTLWELPLAAHEFAHSLTTIKGIKDDLYATSWTNDRQLLMTLFADGFATYSLGPAYACAAILLRLDPTRAAVSPDDTRDLLRARMILGVLAEVDANGSFRNAREELDKQWRAAVIQAGAPGAEPKPEPDQAGEVDTWSKQIVGLLDATTPNAAYQAKRWETIAPVLLDWKDGRITSLPPEADVRDVLNLAWHCLLPPLSAKAGDILERAEKLWDSVGHVSPRRGQPAINMASTR